MSARVSRSFPLPSPLKFEEDAPKFIERQGIVTILGSDFELNKVPPSLRRTISADMSSKKWLAQNGLISPMKRIASSGELAASAADHSSSLPEGEEHYEGHKDELNMPSQDDVWRSIQSQQEKKELEKPTQLDVWSSILAEKTNESNNLELPPPYIHPLVKRSTSTLSEKSLEICTESLGSETGSEGFSSYRPSETGDMEVDKEDAQQQQQQQQQQQKDPQTQSFEELQVAKYNYKPSKKLPPRTFPPPLPSLARGDGPSLHMHSHRKNGRLVLQAVSVPQRNYFHADRQQGRLLLTLVNSPTSQEPSQEEMRDKVEEFGEVFDNFEEVEENEATVDEKYDYEEEEEEEEEEQEEEEIEKQNGIKEMAFAMEQSSSLPSGVINVHRSALVMKSLMGLHNKDPTWSNKLNKAVNLTEMEELVEKLTPIPQSLPPAAMVARLIPSPSAAATAASFNAYEHFWWNKPTVASIIKPVTQQCTNLKDNEGFPAKSNSLRSNEQKDVVLMRGDKADYLVPLLRGCKESRRSLLIRQPSCIAAT